MGNADQDEDDWLLAQFPPDFKGWAVEIGVHDGKSSSNTLALERAGWEVLVVEPNPDFRASIKASRKRYWMGACSNHEAKDDAFYVNLACAGSFSALRPNLNHPTIRPPEGDIGWRVVRVEVATLDTLLARFEFPTLDVLSIDTEGTELDVLRGIDLVRWQPRAIVCEVWGDPDASDEHIKARGYARTGRRNVNNLYLRG